MARGLFITGFTISEVLAIQQRAKGFLIKGKTLFHKTCPNFTPVLPRLNLEEITPFTTPNPFIYVDSACLRSRHEYPNLSSKLFVCLAVYSTGSFTHAQAVAAAAARGGYLATITSAEEQQAVLAAIDPALLEDLTGFWIGASDSVTEGEWRWGTGETFFFSNWGTSRPSTRVGNALDFTEISGGGGAEIGNWYDRTATTVRTAYLLEKSFVTNPLAADTDGDGLDDAVEISHSTLPHVADTDGDGSWDGAEVEFGGAPRDGGIMPEWKTHIRTSAAPEPGVVISFPTLPGKSYSVYASSDLIEWQELRWLTGTGGVMSHSEPRGSHTSRFFKVEASDAPTNPDPVPAPTW